MSDSNFEIDQETGLPLIKHKDSETGEEKASKWEIRTSKSRNLPYYFNQVSHESRWEPPLGTDSSVLSRYMKEHHSTSIVHEEQQKDKIRASHLLVKHRESRRPSSWKESEITRTKDEAMEIIKVHEERIRGGGVSLSDLAQTESDCSSARKGGDLGFFGKGEMQKEFEEAAFALQPGQMSSVVETASGLHLIER